MTDEIIAPLSITVDATQPAQAAKSLDSLAASAGGAEAATRRLTDATKAGQSITSQMIKDVGGYANAEKLIAQTLGQVQAATVAAGTAAKGLTAVTETGAIAQVAAHGKIISSSLAIRESLVLLREAARGNFTRMAGSASILAGAFGLITGQTILIVAGVLALVAPFAVLGIAMAKGAEDAAKLNNALSITNNYAGVTTSSFEAMAQRVAKASDTGIGSAKASIESLIATGKFSAQTIELMASTAARFSEFTGEATSKIIADYETMKGGVVRWAVKHEETYHDLTLAQIDYIANLERQGQHEAAEAKLMQDIHDNIYSKAAPAYGFLQQALHNTAKAASDMWDALLGLGRPATLDQQISDQAARVQEVAKRLKDAAEGKSDNGRTIGNIPALKALLDSAVGTLKGLQDKAGAELRAAQAAAAKAQANDDAIRKKYDNEAPKLKKTKAEPRDTEDERTAQVAGQIATAAAAELQAQLGLTHEIEARAAIQKQIAAADETIKRAQIDKLIADIQDDKGLSDAKQAELVAQLQGVKLVLGHVAVLKDQAADDAAHDALLKETLNTDLARNALTSDLLKSQAAAADFEFQRAPIALAILKLDQENERLKLEEIVASTSSTQAEKDIAAARLKLLGVIDANQIKAVIGGLFETFDKTSSAVGSMASAFKSHDWVGVLKGLDQTIASIQTAFGPGGTLGAKIGAVAGAAQTAGNIIGGTAGHALAGAAGGAVAGFVLFGPIGAAIGAIGGALSSIFGDSAAKKREEQAARAQAIQAEAARVAAIVAQHQDLENRLLEATGQHLQVVANQRYAELQAMDASNQAIAKAAYAAEDAAAIASKRSDLEIALMTAQGNALGVLNAQRKAEVAALQPELQWLQQTVYLAQDQATIAAKAVTDLTTANDNAQQAFATATQGLHDAYNSAAGALQNTITGFTNLADALQAVLDALSTGPQTALSAAAQFAAARSQFRSTAAAAAGGDQTAGGNLSSVAQTFLDAAKATAPNLQAYARDVAEVRNAVTVAKAAAISQVDTATQQLSVLNAQVSGLLTINGSVLSVKDAIDALAVAQSAANAASGALTAAQAAAAPPAATPGSAAKQALLSGDAAAAARYLAANPDLDARYKNPTGNVGDINPVSGESEIQFALRHYLVKGQYEPRQLFAMGGVFTQPTDFNIGRMAEAGPEAIMPLMRGPGGRLGVAANDDGAKDEIRQLRAQVARLETALIQIAINTGQGARTTKKQYDLTLQLTDGGDKMRTVAA